MNARNFFTWALLVLLPSTPSFGHEKVITAKELPAAAQTFINTHFKGKKITEAKKDVEMRKTSYDVTLDNGAKLEFDGKGAWKEIKCKSSACLHSPSLRPTVHINSTTCPFVSG